jgi:hypothetical protein
LLVDNFQVKQIKILLVSESEFSLKTLLLLDPNFGMRWKDKTRSENPKVKLFQSVKSLKKKLIALKTTESYLNILHQQVSLTCTKNSELTHLFQQYLKCTTIWLVDTVPELIIFILLRHSSFLIKMSKEQASNNS